MPRESLKKQKYMYLHELAPQREEQHEWQCFLGLLPLLDLEPVDPVLYQRCLGAVWRLRAAKRISEQELRRAAALDFQGTSEFNLLMVQLVRERVLMPIEGIPFRFAIQRRNWTNPESVYSQDEPGSLIDITRQEQVARLGGIECLEACIGNPRTPQKRARELRVEKDDLNRIYEAVWQELADAIGMSATAAVRQNVERRRHQSEQQQLALPFCPDDGPNEEGEGRCNQ
jgi:hypothetical protein